MSSEQFVYWLQGFLEVSGVEEISKEQTEVIKNHLAEVFCKKTPDVRVSQAPRNGPFDPTTVKIC